MNENDGTTRTPEPGAVVRVLETAAGLVAGTVAGVVRVQTDHALLRVTGTDDPWTRAGGAGFAWERLDNLARIETESDDPTENSDDPYAQLVHLAETIEAHIHTDTDQVARAAMHDLAEYAKQHTTPAMLEALAGMVGDSTEYTAEQVRPYLPALADPFGPYDLAYALEDYDPDPDDDPDTTYYTTAEYQEVPTVVDARTYDGAVFRIWPKEYTPTPETVAGWEQARPPVSSMIDAPIPRCAKCRADLTTPGAVEYGVSDGRAAHYEHTDDGWTLVDDGETETSHRLTCARCTADLEAPGAVIGADDTDASAAYDTMMER